MSATTALTRSRRPSTVAALLMAGVLTTAACGNSSPSDAEPAAADSTTPTAEATPTADAREIVVALPGTFPPLDYIDQATDTPTGFSVDLIAALAKQKGWTVKHDQLSFPGLLPAVTSAHADIALDTYVTPDREKKVDMLTYLTDGLVVGTRPDSKATKLTDYCGRPLGAVAGNPTVESLIADADKECKSLGKSKIDLRTYQTDQQELHDLLNKRLDGFIDGATVMINFVKERKGQVKSAFMVGPVLQLGMAINKSTDLKTQLEAPLADFVASPEYTQLAEKYGIPEDLLLK